MIFIQVFSSILLLIFCYLLLRSSHFDRIAGLALSFKIFAGIALGLIYKHYYQGGDTFEYFVEAKKVASYLCQNPAQAFYIYFDSGEVPDFYNTLRFTNEPRALFFAKITSIFYVLTGGNYWLIGAYFSLLSFTGVYFLVNELKRNFTNQTSAVVYSFYFLPTFVFWSSGLLKESLAVACLCGIFCVALAINRTVNYSRISYWICFVICFWILWNLKYYFAAVALPFLVILIFYKVTEKYKKWRPITLLALLLISFIIISNTHYNLNPSRTADIIYRNYLIGQNSASGNYIRYHNFDGSLGSFIMNLPIALFSGLFRPMVGETKGFFQLLVALENLLVMVMFFMALWRSRSLKNDGNVLFMLLSFLYVCTMAAMLAFSTPNFGTLSRYKVGYWPFFVLLLLTFLLRKQKGQNQKETGLNYKI